MSSSSQLIPRKSPSAAIAAAVLLTTLGTLAPAARAVDYHWNSRGDGLFRNPVA